MKKKFPNRVYLLLICLLVPVLSQRELGNNSSTGFQDSNDTQLQTDLGQLNRYPKITTQLSSVSLDPVISFLQLSSGQTADLPISSQSKLNQRTDFTVMFWFKVDVLPKYSEIMQIFSIQKTLSCFIDSLPSIQCNSVGIQSLRVVSESIISGKWNHLTVSFFAASQTAFLMLQDDNDVLAINYSKDAAIIQSLGQWSACFGVCIQKRNGFVGGVREFIVRSSYMLPEKVKLAKNEIANYNTDIKAYYRFSYDNQRFFSDQFVQRSFYWRSGVENQTIADWRGATMVPQNVCPQTFNYSQLLRFDLAQQVRPYQLTVPVKSTKYSYQMVLTLMNNGSSCYTTNLQTAIDGCNLVHLDDVFMLYFQSANVARFFFFATKNYYQTQSPVFFIPNNQWVTIKLFMSQQGGYYIFVLDQDSKVLYQFVKQYDMQEQSPKKKLFLFQSLVGYASKFILSDEIFKIPSSSLMPKSPLVVLDFKATVNQSGQLSADIINRGRNKVNAQLMFYPKVDLVIDPSPVTVKGQIFDGITCEDGHQVIRLDQKNSYLNFSTSPLEFVNNTQNASIEFWFKFQNPESYNEQSQLFQAIDAYVDPFEHNYTYWVISLNDSKLNIAPFGLASQNESAVISFSELNKENEDALGWWHIACAFQFNVSIECFLSNSVLKVSRGYYMINVVKAFPTYSLDAHFGQYKSEISAPVGLLLKEVRWWQKVLTQDEVQQKKQMQVDPAFDDDILVYLKLTSLKNAFFNLVQLNKLHSFVCLGSYNQVSLVPDMTLIEYTRYNYQTGFLEVATLAKSHVVCPAYTYLKDEVCYSEPINQVVLAVFPILDANTGQLTWKFTLEYTSTIKDSLMDLLQIKWSSSDLLLNNLLQKNQLSQEVSSFKLRQENIYEISAVVTNPGVTFYMQDFVRFIPNSCQWFEVDGFDAQSAYVEFLEMPGESNLDFKLSLRQQTSLNCQQRTFYNSFQSITFQYFVSGSAQRIGIYPNATYTLSSESNPFDIPTAPDLKIDVSIPAAELAQLPTFTNIRILMNITWTASDYADVQNQVGNSALFQHVLLTVNYQTAEGSLLTANLQPKNKVVAIDQTVVLDASKVSTRNIDMQFVIVAFSWQCPTYFTAFCSLQSGNNLTIPWSVFSQSGAPYEETLQFQVTVALVRDGQVIYLATAQSNIVWYDIVKPEFQVDFRPRPILVSQPQDTYFSIMPKNFPMSNFTNFTIQWQVYGQLAGRQSISFQNLSQVMMVPSDSWKTNSSYSISCTLTYTKSAIIQTNVSFVAIVYGQPYGGLTYISPRQGKLGDDFFIYLQGWESYLDTSSIFYTVFNTLDYLGNQVGQQLTTRPMFQNETFYFRAQSIYPLLVKIGDSSGEITISRVVGFILTDNLSIDLQTQLSKSFDGAGSRHLADTQSQLNPESAECDYIYTHLQVQNLASQSICRQSDVLGYVHSIMNQTCKSTLNQKHSALIELYDIIADVKSSCRNEIFLKLEVLDQIVQTNAQEYDVEVLKRARISNYTDVYNGISLQLIRQIISPQSNVSLGVAGVKFFQNSQPSLDLSEFDASAQLQLITVQGRYSSLALVQIYDVESLQYLSLSSLSGQISLNFDVIPEMYIPNITLCAVVALDQTNISFDSCLTELQESSFQVICTCNIITAGEAVTVTNDYSRTQGPPVKFPDHKVVVFAAGISHIKTSSYLFISIISSISLYGLIGFAISTKLDKRDQQQQTKAEEIVDNFELQKISTLLGRPLSQVKIQMDQLRQYRSEDGATVLHVAKAIHPFFSPYTYLNPYQARSLRFSTYHSQVNVLVIVVLLFYGRSYREGDHRFEEVLDLADIQSACFALVLGCIFLLPVLSEQCNRVSGKPNRKYMRIIIYALSFALNLFIILTAIFTAHQAPASNQYLIATAITGSLIGSLIFTNIVRVLFNSYKAPQPLCHLQSSLAQNILAEIECMRQIGEKELGKEKSEFSLTESPQTESALNLDQPLDDAGFDLSNTSEQLDSSRKLDERIKF